MKTFEICLTTTNYHTALIEAETEDQAIRKAEELITLNGLDVFACETTAPTLYYTEEIEDPSDYDYPLFKN